MRRTVPSIGSAMSVGLGRFSAARMVTLLRSKARLMTGLLLFCPVLIVGF